MIQKLSILIFALMTGSCGDDAGPTGSSPTNTTAEPSTSDEEIRRTRSADSGLPDDGMRDDGMPDDGMRDDGMPDDGMRDDGMPDDGMPDDGMRDDGMPDDGMPDDGMRDDGMPDGGMPGNGMPGNGMPGNAPNGYVQPAPWAQLTKAQRFAFMANVVVPRMRAIFTAVDPSFQNLGCKTCHGENANEVAYTMPNGVSPLDPTKFPLTASDDPKIARMAKVMGEEVVPTMAALLDMQPRSRQNPTGFGCFGCHGRVE